MLKYFETDTNRDKLYPDLACYQMNVADMATKALEAGHDEELLPSWSKFGTNPLKASGFFTYMLQAVFEGKHGADNLNVKYQIGGAKDRRVAMMFLASANNKNLMASADIARDALPGYEVIVLCGHKENKINGHKVTNRNAQQLVKESMHLNGDKNVLILSNQMAARSFSIPDITELYLAYDNGDNGATVQKMSRTLTPRDLSKIGRVFSLSFDPNRDDKFDAMVMEAALKVKKDNEDVVSAIRRVLRSVDIFECTEDGAQLFNEAKFIEDALKRSALSRVMGKVADIDAIPDSIVTDLANGNIDVQQATKVMASAKGTTHEAIEREASESTREATANERAKVREMIVTIIENADVIVFGSGKTNVMEALGEIVSLGEQSVVEEEFGVPFNVVKFIFETGIIKQEWIDIRMSAEK